MIATDNPKIFILGLNLSSLAFVIAFYPNFQPISGNKGYAFSSSSKES